MLLENQKPNNRVPKSIGNEVRLSSEVGAMFSSGFHPSETKGNYITLFIIDASGSMSRLSEAVAKSYNQAVKELLNEAVEFPSLVQHMAVNTFSNRSVYEQLPLTTVLEEYEIQELTYRTGGFTPLMDGLGKSIIALDIQINRSGVDQKNVKVSVVVFTDGMENSSVDYNLSDVQQLIRNMKLTGWEFHYHGHDRYVKQMADELFMDYAHEFEHSAMGFQGTVNKFSKDSKLSKGEFNQNRKKY